MKVTISTTAVGKTIQARSTGERSAVPLAVTAHTNMRATRSQAARGLQFRQPSTGEHCRAPAGIVPPKRQVTR